MLRTAAFGIGLLIAGAAGEAAVRVYGHFKGEDLRLVRLGLKDASRLPAAMWPEEGGPGVMLRPNADVVAKCSDFAVRYSINSHGLRDREYSYARNPGRVRILAVGDSFTFGEGVPYGERFTDIAEAHFPDSEIIDFAVPGYGIEHELTSLLYEGLRYSPDYVVLFINRVDTDRRIRGFVREGRVMLPEHPLKKHFVKEPSRGTVYVKAAAGSAGGRLFWYDHSQFFNFVMSRVELWRLQRVSIAEWGGKALEIKPDGSVPEKESDQSVRERAGIVLKKYAELANKHHFRLLVVNIDADSDLSYLKEAIPKLEYYDLSTDLSRRAKTMPLRFVYDRHFNPETNRFLGQKLIEILGSAIPQLNKKG